MDTFSNEIYIALYTGVNSNKISTFDKLISGWQWVFSKDKLYTYTHVELVVDGVFYTSSPLDGGVRAKRIDMDSGDWDFIPIKVSAIEKRAIINMFNELMGSKYDWLGIYLSQILKMDFDSQSRWFCSEIVAYVLDYTLDLNLKKKYNHYDPATLVRELVLGRHSMSIMDSSRTYRTYTKGEGGFLSLFKFN